MPTGYTSPIQDGSVNTAREFMITCMKAFVPDIYPITHPMPQFEHTELFARLNNQAENARAHLELLQSYDLQQWEELMRKDSAQPEHWVNDTKAFRDKLQTIRTEIKDWAVPDNEYDQFKEFMLDQLADSIDETYLDENALRTPVDNSVISFRNRRLKEAHDASYFAYDYVNRAREAYDKKKTWVDKLWEHLPQ